MKKYGVPPKPNEIDVVIEKLELLQFENKRFIEETEAEKKLLLGKINIGNKLLQETLDMLPCGLSVCADKTCKEILHNSVASKFFDITEWENFSHSNEETQKSCSVLHAGRKLMPEEMPIQLAMWQGQETRNIELDIVFPDGKQKTLQYSCKPLFDEKGNVIAAISTHEDITKKKIARLNSEKKLQQSENLFYTSIENILDCFCLYTADRDKNGEIVDFIIEFVNDAACSSRKLCKEEQIGKKMLELFPKHYESKIFKEYCDVVNTGKPLIKEKFYFVDPLLEPSSKVYDIRAAKMGDGLIVTWRDITESFMMEEQFKRLEQLNLIGQMAAGIGHEIRNPMTSIRGFLQLLRNKTELSRYESYFNTMISEVDRANEIITNFLSLTKKNSVELTSQNLNSLIQNLLSLIKVNAMKTQTNILCDLGDIPELLVNKNETNQIIINLVRNGIESMPSGGTLTIKTLKENGYVKLSIIDQGSGIDENIRERIGTPFFTTKAEGTGLGLAICYSIAERNNAAIDFYSSNKGTCFNVIFKIQSNLTTG